MDANPDSCTNLDSCAYLYAIANGVTNSYFYTHTIADSRAYGHTCANDYIYCYARARRTYTKATKLG